ncbi:hypothetical protein CORT_0G04300 [Candida orthopsilosis Co 90-125]|uniref:Uncharacterized protein n=1 Tax=Candida orthopsilosis (strain 90-125) TaxID=1136231 RepID=H8XAD0_CANO9|nr:hypothetical protein CORT_0G04300 [Candida orthopsilosis Co 90-125]CCG25107.1 hypothetical protein CORT_0G04300 [Candida orthopsilosis Co 90-125]
MSQSITTTGSLEFQVQVMIKTLRQLGYDKLSSDLLHEYRTQVQRDNESGIPVLLSWFHNALRTNNYRTIDDYLVSILQTDHEEFMHITNYLGEDHRSVINSVLYMVRRMDYCHNHKSDNEFAYLWDKLLPLLDVIDIDSISDLYDAQILDQLKYENEAEILTNEHIPLHKLFFSLPGVDNNIQEVQDVIFKKVFKNSHLIFLSPTHVPSLSTIIDQSVKYQQSQSPLYLPPRNKHEWKKLLSTQDQSPTTNNFNVTKLHYTLTDHLDEVWFLKFSPSGKFLVTGSLDGRLILYNVYDNFQRIKIMEPTNAADSAAFVPFSIKPSSGKTKAVIYCCWDPKEQYLVSCCLDTVIRIWSIGDIDRKRITRSEANTSHDIKLMTCFTLGQDIKTWSCEFLPYTKETSISSSTPQFIIGSPDKALKVFDCHGVEIFDFYGNLEDEDDEKSQHNIDGFGILDPNPSSGTLSGSRRSHDATTNGDAVINDEEDVNDDEDNRKDDISMKDVDAKSTFTESPFNRINDLAITPDGRFLITANNDKKLLFYRIPDVFNDESTTRKLACINLRGRLTSCSVSSNGKYVLINSAPEELQVWDISPLLHHDPPILYRKYIGHSQSTYIVRSSFGYLNEETGEEELVMSGSDDGFVYFWKLHTGQLISRVKAHVDLCNAVDWNLHGSVVRNNDYGKLWGSVGDDKLVKIWGT